MNWESLWEKIKDWPSQYARRTADAVAGAGISIGRDLTLTDEDIRWAQYSAILDRRTCSWCRFLDGKIISVKHPDYVSREYHPPAHQHCRCLWIYITKWEPNVTPTWTTPTEEDLEKYEGRFPFNDWKIRGVTYRKLIDIVMEGEE